MVTLHMKPMMYTVLNLLALTLLVNGCDNGPKTPTLTPVNISVTVNGKPLPSARVKLIPTNPEHEANGIAMGSTNEKGKAEMEVAGLKGATIGENQIVIDEAELSGDAYGRDASQAEQMKAQNELKQRPNRPIPKKYNTLATSDLKLTIEEGKTDYTLELKR